MKKISKLILGSSLLIASTLSFAGDDSDGNNYRYSDGPYNDNDWSNTPWGQNNAPVNRNDNRSSSGMPWGGRNSPWGSDNPVWDSGSSMWRDWDTNKWGGNGMPWGGGNGMMPWSKKKKKNKKYNKNYDNRGYGRPYGGGYGNPYQGGGYNPYQGGGYGGNPYNAGQGYAPAQ